MYTYVCVCVCVCVYICFIYTYETNVAYQNIERKTGSPPQIAD